MAQQIKKKFIGNDQIDSTKIKLLQEQAIRATDSSGEEVELLKLGTSDEVLSKGQEIAFKSQVEAEEAARIAADDLRVNKYGDQMFGSLYFQSPEYPNLYCEILPNEGLHVGGLTNTFKGDRQLLSSVRQGEIRNEWKLENGSLESGISLLDGRIKLEKINYDNNTSTEMLSDDGQISLKLFDSLGNMSPSMPIEPEHVTTKAYVDGKVDKDGDTMNGALIIDSGNPVKAMLDDNGLSFESDSGVPIDGGLAHYKPGSMDVVYRTQEDEFNYIWFNSANGFIWAKEISGITGRQPVLPTTPEHVVVKAYVDQEVSALDERIDTLQAITWHTEKFVVDAAIIAAGSLTLSQAPIAGSVVAFVDRLAIFEGASEDFTMSGSIMSFSGELLSSGSQPLTVGDVIRIKYQA